MRFRNTLSTPKPRILLAAALVAALTLLTPPSRAMGDGLKEVGVLPAAHEFPGPTPFDPGLLVDPILHRGFLVELSFESNLFVYDLRDFSLIARRPLPPDFTNSTRPFAAVDAKHHRIFLTDHPKGNQGVACDDQALWVLDTRTFEMTRRTFPCLSQPVPTGYVINGLSYHEPSNKLYVVGMPAILAEDVYFSTTSPPRQPTVIRQLDADTLTADWDADVSDSCEWHQDRNQDSATVVRARDAVVVYCFQGGVYNPTGTGGRGAALVLPLHDGRPVMRSGKPDVQISSTFTDANVIRVVDPVSGRLILVATQRPFGPAAWVYDPFRQLFVGVVPTGVDPNKENSFDYAFDETSGRLYVHSSRGIVVVDARHTPLPGGVTYEVATGPISDVRGAVPMSVDPILGRLFIPNEDRKGWRVIEDRVPPPPPVEPPDPDSGTADIPEQPGVTDRTYSGSAAAFGVHTLLAGGIPTIVHQFDAREDCVHRLVDRTSPCLADVATSPGNREYFLAQTSGEQSAGGGTSAFATAGRVAPRDYATDADVRSVGACYADRVQRVAPPAGSELHKACPRETPAQQHLTSTPLRDVTFERLRGGTAPRHDGGDFPIPSSFCADGGGGVATDADTTPMGMGGSSVKCSFTAAALDSTAETRAAALDGIAPGQPAISVGRSYSAVHSRLDAELGMVTTAEAVVENVRIGEHVRIGSIRTEATTTAFGRSGTTKASARRLFSGVRTPTYSCDSEGTCDPAHVVAGINAAFGTVASPRMPQPYTFASPRGYTAVVAKDPDLAASDAAMNDDDSVTFNGLDLIVINDYNRDNGADGQQNAARSRLVISFAGVQAESHYGIFPLPKQAGGDLLDGGPLGPSALGGADAGPYGPGLPGPGGMGPLAPRPAPGLGRPDFRIPRSIPEAAAHAARLIVNNPREAALLALFLAILVSPLYFAVRRRAVASVYRA